MKRFKLGSFPSFAAATLAVLMVGTSLMPQGAPGGTLIGDSRTPPISRVLYQDLPSSDAANDLVVAEPTLTREAPAMAVASPDEVGLDGERLNRIDEAIERGQEKNLYPSAVVLVARDAAIAKEESYGHAVLYDADSQKLAQPIAASDDTIYDLASVTKLYTATAVMKLYEEGKVELDEPVATYIPEFAANGKGGVTVRQLLTHTSGFPAGISLGGAQSTQEQRESTLFRAKLVSKPGQTYCYSDVNFMVLGKLVERVSGDSLDVFLSEKFFQPLGMKDTMFNPPEELCSRVAATEVYPGGNRSLAWGEVHDGSAYVLGGVAGNAGLFSTAQDVAVFGQMVANGGEFGGVRVLAPETVAEMLKPQSGLPKGDHMGLGWELNESWYMGDMVQHGAAGHTGYTGTSLVISPKTGTVVVLLTNRVHPVAEKNTNEVRKATTSCVASAIEAKA